MSKAKALEHLDNPFHWVDFSRQQRRVIKQACFGKTAAVIAANLGIETRTAIHYIHNALVKINLTDHSNLSLRDLPGKLLKDVEKELRA
jgi:DNA-binding NarL/FixJ family response regulator